MSKRHMPSNPSLARRLASLLIAAALPAQAALQPYTLDFESDWPDLAPNTFVQLSTLNPSPGGLRWGNAWYGQTAALGNNNELRLGVGNFQVDAYGQPFYLDSVDFRSLQNGGNIKFGFFLTLYSETAPAHIGSTVVYDMRIDGAPTVPGVPVTSLYFSTFTEMAGIGPLLSFTFGAFQAGGETTDRNLFVMDNLVYRLDPLTSPVPEPRALALFGLGLGLLGLRRLRR